MTDVSDILIISCLLIVFQLFIILTLLCFIALIFFKKERRQETMKKTARITKTIIPAKCIYLGLDIARKGKKITPMGGVEKKTKTNK